MDRVRRVKNRYHMTLPAAVSRALGLKPGDRVAYVVNGETVTIANAKMRVRPKRIRADPMRDWDTPEDDEAFRSLSTTYARTRVFSGS
jgi:bifunctional DNA-binding transcriptional regulator/antitoxin component of YhaV-PrlF toxin-antitoxin module